MIRLSSENLRFVSGLTYDREVAAISKWGRGSGNNNHGAATGVLGGDLVVAAKLDGGAGQFGAWLDDPHCDGAHK